MPMTPRQLYYNATLVCRDPRVQWEVTSIVEVELTKEEIASECMIHEGTHYWLEDEKVWVQEPIDKDYVRLIVCGSNIQDALVKVWAQGLYVARSRAKATTKTK